MTYQPYPDPPRFEQFGNLLIILGILPIASFALGFILGLLGFEGFFLQVLLDVTTVILLIVLVINNQKIKTILNLNTFSGYYSMLIGFFILTLIANVFYYIAYIVVWDAHNWLNCLIIYDILYLIVYIFEIIAWIRLGKYGATLRPPIEAKIRNGTTLLAIGAGIGIAFVAFDILSVFVFAIDVMLVVILILGLAKTVISVIGYFITGANIKKIPLISRITEPVVEGSPQYYPPPEEDPTYSPYESQSGRFCIKCGTKLLPDATFCHTCGWHIVKD
ncbi:MAG: hypothetical protein JW776_04345 [Candidatus Lokiarchaeota archaeon]|nr:hypothetical protein [Candidatus Lokiarchaeota archaeon]